MTSDESLMFHLTGGYLRRWSLWNEPVFPSFAPGEETKWQLFQSWKANPYKVIGTNEDGTQQVQYHPMAEFENWPYWLILDLARYVFKHEPFADLMIEPEQLKEEICNFCDAKFSDNEGKNQPFTQPQ